MSGHGIDIHGFRISYLSDYPEYVPQLAQWMFEEWDSILGERNTEIRIKKLKGHMNREQLPIAWVAHGNGELLGTAALRVHDLEGREDLTPGSAEYLSARSLGVAASVRRYALPSRKRLGREEYKLSICLRSTSRRGIYA